MEMLQLCGHPVIGWQDAPLGIFGLWPIQVATVRNGGGSLDRGLVARAFHLYRDVEELLSPSMVRTTITSRDLVQRYAPQLQRCLRRHLKPTNDSRCRQRRA